MMLYSDKSLSLLVLLLVGLQHNIVNTHSNFQLDEQSRILLSREKYRNSQLTTLSADARFNPQVSQIAPQNLQFDERISDLISNRVLRFSQRLGVKLAETQYSKSEVFSPLSVMSALALLMLGAKGRSYDELRKLFGIDTDPELLHNPSKFHNEFGYMLEDLQLNSDNAKRSRKSSEWRDTVVNHNMRNNNNNNNNNNAANGEHITKIANGIFTQIDYNLNPDYRAVVNSVYAANIKQLDFARQQSEARDYINNWVSDSTYGKITNIIKGLIPSGTNVILASALYFKGFWENSFFELATIQDNFYPDRKNEPPVKVQMMATGGVFPYHDSVEHDCRIIGFPYKGNKTAMYIIQPNQSTRQRLQQFQRHLTPELIEDLISKMIRKTAIVAFPKFHLVRSMNMRSVLNQMGVNDIFSSGVSDLSLISGVTETSTQPTYANVVKGNYQQVANPSEEMRFVSISTRSRRQAPAIQVIYSRKSAGLDRLEYQRTVTGERSDLFVEDIVHKVDFDVNEQGTEAAAATLTYLRRSGTDVLFRTEEPFIFLIRDDPTKLILFYGYYNEPDN